MGLSRRGIVARERETAILHTELEPATDDVSLSKVLEWRVDHDTAYPLDRGPGRQVRHRLVRREVLGSPVGTAALVDGVNAAAR